MSSSPTPAVDKVTFEFGELRAGVPAAHAYANMAHRFISSFATRKEAPSNDTKSGETSTTPTEAEAPPPLSKAEHQALYQTLVRTVFESLLRNESLPHDAATLEVSLKALIERQKKILDEERERTNPRRKKWDAPTKVVNLEESSSDSEEDEATLERKRAEREKRIKAEEEAWLESCRLEEKREIEREENEAKLLARQRKVDTTENFEQLLKGGEGGSSMVMRLPSNAASNAKGRKKKGNGGVLATMTVEEWGAVLEEQFRLRKEKELCEEVLHSVSGKEQEEVPTMISALQAEVGALEAEVVAKKVPEVARAAPKAPTKGQITEGTGKTAKLQQEKNRMMLQLKAIEVEPAELMVTLTECIQKKAALLTKLRRVE